MTPASASRLPTMSGVSRQHAAGGNWPGSCALHERVEPAFPPLIERGRARRGQRRPEDGMEKRDVIDRAGGAQIEADRSGEQNQKSQARLDEFREIRTHAAGGFRFRRRRLNVYRRKRGGFHDACNFSETR